MTISCPCGTATLETTGEPMISLHCHCDDCQAVHGAALAAVIVFPEAAVKAGDGVEVWKHKTIDRGRCKACGARMYANPPGVIGINAAYAPAEMFQPQWHQQCRFATIQVGDKLPHFAGLPTAFGGPNDDVVSW